MIATIPDLFQRKENFMNCKLVVNVLRTHLENDSLTPLLNILEAHDLFPDLTDLKNRNQDHYSLAYNSTNIYTLCKIWDKLFMVLSDYADALKADLYIEDYDSLLYSCNIYWFEFNKED